MAGSDLPSGGSGAAPLPRTPPRSRKRKRRAVAGPRPATRSSARTVVAVADAVWWARRAAAGTLWTKRGRDLADVEGMREVILEVRRVRSDLEPDDPDSPYPQKHKKSQKIHTSGTRSSERIACQMRHLSSYHVSTRKRTGLHPVEYQAFVPEWKNAPSEKDTADYKIETLQKLGTVVCPLNMDISATDEPEETRKARVDKCNCSHPGSGACVRVHVKRARSWLNYQLGEEAFRNCGLVAMGEQVLKLWTAEDKKKLEDIEKLIPQNKHEKFMKIASKQFSSKKTKDLVKYYYNVFLPRRLASLTRAEPTNAKDVDTDDEDNNQDDDSNEHHSEENSKNSGSSSKRSRK